MRHMHNATIRRLVLAALVLATCAGCSIVSGYNQQFKHASRFLPVDLAGAWEGTWHSEVTPHNGKLTAIFTRQDDYHYQAKFHAHFFKFFAYGYTVVLNVSPGDDCWVVTGEKDLGKLAGGVYHYTGTATPCHFFSRYCCSKDHGEFEMRRVVTSCDAEACGR